MADVIPYPMAHCIHCWSDNCDHGVRDGGKVLGPYCRPCAKKQAEAINSFQRQVEQMTETRR